jgi:hypothetical protein
VSSCQDRRDLMHRGVTLCYDAGDRGDGDLSKQRIPRGVSRQGGEDHGGRCLNAWARAET